MSSQTPKAAYVVLGLLTTYAATNQKVTEVSKPFTYKKFSWLHFISRLAPKAPKEKTAPEGTNEQLQVTIKPIILTGVNIKTWLKYILLMMLLFSEQHLMFAPVTKIFTIRI